MERIHQCQQRIFKSGSIQLYSTLNITPICRAKRWTQPSQSRPAYVKRIWKWPGKPPCFCQSSC